MAAGTSLFDSGDCSLWEAALAAYSNVLKKKAAEKKSSKSKANELLELDDWYQDKLPEVIAGRDQPHLTHPELCKLMKWKLTRGKFRPRLTELVKENKPEEVEAVSKVAFERSPSVEAAIKHLCQLKAVGPATASAILCSYTPSAPFMADESVLSVPGLGKLEYNLKHYMSYASKIQDKVDMLNESGTTGRSSPWTSHEVEKALWAYYLASKYDVHIDSQTKEGHPGSKRVNSKQASQPPPAKKKK